MIFKLLIPSIISARVIFIFIISSRVEFIFMRFIAPRFM